MLNIHFLIFDRLTDEHQIFVVHVWSRMIIDVVKNNEASNTVEEKDGVDTEGEAYFWCQDVIGFDGVRENEDCQDQGV